MGTFITVLSLAIAGFGIFGNANIVWASIRKPGLRGTCNIFIAIAAFADILHQSSHIINAYYNFAENGLVPQLKCFYSMCVPLYGALLTPCMMLFISFDRLLCVSKPLAYSSIANRTYLYSIVAASLLFPLPVSIFGYFSVQPSADTMVACLTVNGYADDATTLFLASSSAINICTLIPYGVLWMRVKVKKFDRSRQTLKSLTIVSVVMSASYLSTTLSGMVWTLFVERLPDIATTTAGLAINFCTSMNYPIFFFARSLRGNCHIFIAITALGDIFHQSAHFITAYYKFKLGGSVAQIQCFCVPLYGALLTPCMFLFISLDRILCILKPLAYPKNDFSSMLRSVKDKSPT